MSNKLQILIVEDSPSDIQSYQDTITTLNMELSPSLIIEAVYARSKEEGIGLIHEMKDVLDGAFIDLKLQSGTTIEVNEGNELIQEIYGKLRFPVIVLTNTPGAFNSDFTKSIFLQVQTKTDIEYRDVIMSLVAIKKTGITRILGRKGLVEEMLDQIFWKNISTTLSLWLNVDNSEKALLRYTLTHLQEHLEVSDDGSEFVDVVPIENYIKPSIKDYFFTGDIVTKRSDSNKRFVILTPACDLAPHGQDKVPKAKDVLLAEIQTLANGLFFEKIKIAKMDAISDDKVGIIESAKDDLKKIITNNYSPKYYYLPNTSIIPGGLINFQKLNSVKLSDLNENYEKEATITIQFVKDIIARFSFYYSRQGSPDFDFNKILASYL